jgi:hypothetical protein
MENDKATGGQPAGDEDAPALEEAQEKAAEKREDEGGYQ